MGLTQNPVLSLIFDLQPRSLPQKLGDKVVRNWGEGRAYHNFDLELFMDIFKDSIPLIQRDEYVDCIIIKYKKV